MTTSGRGPQERARHIHCLRTSATETPSKRTSEKLTNPLEPAAETSAGSWEPAALPGHGGPAGRCMSDVQRGRGDGAADRGGRIAGTPGSGR
jgi:hypothetical protein